MKVIVVSIFGLVSFLYFIFSEAGSDTHYLSIAGMLTCIFVVYGVVTTLVGLAGFIAWHFTNFLSDSWLDFLLLPLISACCFIYAVCRIQLLQTVLRGRPMGYGGSDGVDIDL